MQIVAAKIATSIANGLTVEINKFIEPPILI